MPFNLEDCLRIPLDKPTQFLQTGSRTLSQSPGVRVKKQIGRQENGRGLAVNLPRAGEQLIEVAESGRNTTVIRCRSYDILIVRFALISDISCGIRRAGRGIGFIREQLLTHFAQFFFHGTGAFNFGLSCCDLRRLGVHSWLLVHLGRLGGIDLGRGPEFLDVLFERPIKLPQIFDRS